MGLVRRMILAAWVAVPVHYGPLTAVAAPGPIPAKPLADAAAEPAGFVCLPVRCWWRPQPIPTWLPRTGCNPCYVRGRPVWGGATSYWWFPSPDWGGPYWYGW